jgi:hypothetical protein
MSKKFLLKITNGQSLVSTGRALLADETTYIETCIGFKTSLTLGPKTKVSLYKTHSLLQIRTGHCTRNPPGSEKLLM